MRGDYNLVSLYLASQCAAQNHNAEEMITEYEKALDLVRMQINCDHAVSPATLKRSATTLAESGTLGFSFWSCLP